MNDSDSKQFDCSVMASIGVYTVILLIVTIALCVFTILAMLRNKELLTKIDIPLLFITIKNLIETKLPVIIISAFKCK
jgi:hypothetical protein